MKEGPRVILRGVVDGKEVAMQHLAGRDTEGFWVDIALYEEQLAPEEIGFVRMRPATVREFADENPAIFEVILSAGIHALIEDDEFASDEEAIGQFSGEFLDSIEEVAKERGTCFYGPVGSIHIGASSSVVPELQEVPVGFRRWLSDQFGRFFSPN